MSCFQKRKNEAGAQEQQRIRDARRAAAVIIPDQNAMMDFLRHCEVYCVLDCCGFLAIDQSPATMQAAVKACGKDLSSLALEEMRRALQSIEHREGLVCIFGYYEEIEDVRKNLVLCIELTSAALQSESDTSSDLPTRTFLFDK